MISREPGTKKPRGILPTWRPFKCPPQEGEEPEPPEEKNGTSCPFRAPRRRLLATPRHGVAPPDPRGGQALPRCRRNGSPSHWSIRSEGKTF
jgi:hypothetical protein